MRFSGAYCIVYILFVFVVFCLYFVCPVFCAFLSDIHLCDPELALYIFLVNFYIERHLSNNGCKHRCANILNCIFNLCSVKKRSLRRCHVMVLASHGHYRDVDIVPFVIVLLLLMLLSMFLLLLLQGL